jgi:tRNA A37 threonylcarbamoyltransferase TsaD
MTCVIGLDIGTTSTIGILIRMPSDRLALASRSVTLTHRHAGWAEEDPQQWWRNVCEIVPELLQQAGVQASEVQAVGVSGMVPAVVLLGADGQLLRPSIQQSDGRCAQEVQALRAAFDEAAFTRRTGNGINQQLVAAKLRSRVDALLRGLLYDAHGERMHYPCVGLVASGGHTSLFLVRGPTDLERLGGTIDDAAGEAFDKAASVLGLGYPGGPQIEAAAVGGNPKAHRLPRPLANDHERLDLSFSGLKTALRYLVRPPGSPADVPIPQGKALADLAASFQQAAIDSILAKLSLALDRTGCKVLAIGGGVTANTLLRESVERLGRRRGVDLLIPPRSLCTDNAAMGAIAWDRLERGENDGLELDVLPGTDRSAARRK